MSKDRYPQPKDQPRSWLDKPISRREVIIGTAAGIFIGSAGGTFLARMLWPDSKKEETPFKDLYTKEDEDLFLTFIDHCNWLGRELINPEILSKHKIEVSKTGYETKHIVDLKYRIEKAKEKEWSIVGIPATMDIDGEKYPSVTYNSYFDQNAEIFLTYVNFYDIQIPELENFRLPPNDFNMRNINPQFYREVAETMLKIPSEAQWRDLENSRFEVKYNLKGVYPVRIRPNGLPKVEIAFNQKGIEFSNKHKDDPYFFK